MKTSSKTPDDNSRHSHARDLCIILLFFLLITSVGKAALKREFVNPDFNYYIDVSMQLLLYGLLVLFSIRHLRLTRLGVSKMMGALTRARLIVAVGLGAVLFAFAHSENAVEAFLLAQYNPQFAYSRWPFHPDRVPAWKALTGAFALHLFVGVIVAPMVEEFYFRGLLFSAFRSRVGIKQAAIASGVIFIIAHLQHPYIVSTLVFSVILSLLYVATESIILCAVAHGVFNLMAIISENFFLNWLIRSEQDFLFARMWYAEFALWIISASIIVWSINRFRSHYRRRNIPAPG